VRPEECGRYLNARHAQCLNPSFVAKCTVPCRNARLLTLTVAFPSGKLFWGPMGSPYNKRYTLPTGSEEDTPWVQLVSWKGTIDADNNAQAKQKSQLIRRTEKPPYPPMLKYNAQGALGVASEVSSTLTNSPRAPAGL